MKKSSKFFLIALWALIASAAALVALISWSLNRELARESEKALGANVKSMAQLSAKSIQIFLDGLISEMVLLSEIDAVKQYDRSAVDIAFRGIVAKNLDLISYIALLDGNGIENVALTKLTNRAALKPVVESYYRKAVGGWRVDVDDRWFALPGFNAIGFGMPIFRKSESGSFAPDRSIYASGMIVSIIDLADLSERFLIEREPLAGSRAWIITHTPSSYGSEQVIALAQTLYPDDPNPLGELNKTLLDALKNNKVPTGWSRFDLDRNVIQIDLPDKRWYLSSAPVKVVDKEWRILIAAERSAITDLIYANMLKSMSLFALVALTLIAGGSALTRFRVRAARAEAKSAMAAQLESKNHELSELNRRLDEFVTIVSHDIRSPLNVIRGLTSLIQSDERAGPTFKRETDTILLSCERLGRLVNDILDIAKIESGKVMIDESLNALNGIIEEALEEARFAGAEKNLNFKVDLPDSIRIKSDRSKLAQLFDNLISNAIKFSPRNGTVTIRARKDQSNSIVQIDVIDEGPGIPKESAESIFDKFEQIKRVDSPNATGSGGLGLTIAKGIAELHGGSIRALEVGAGATGARLRLTLPLA